MLQEVRGHRRHRNACVSNLVDGGKGEGNGLGDEDPVALREIPGALRLAQYVGNRKALELPETFREGIGRLGIEDSNRRAVGRRVSGRVHAFDSETNNGHPFPHQEVSFNGSPVSVIVSSPR